MAACRYCDEAGSGFRVYLLGTWINLDEKCHMASGWRMRVKIIPNEFLAESLYSYVYSGVKELQEPTLLAYNTISHFSFTNFYQTIQEPINRCTRESYRCRILKSFH